MCIERSLLFERCCFLASLLILSEEGFTGVVNLIDVALVDISEEDEVCIKANLPSRKYMILLRAGIVTMKANKSSMIVVMKRYIIPRQFMWSTLFNL